MTSRIDLSPEHLRLVRAILREHVPDRNVRAFGSRVTGNAKPMSDLDVCIMGEAPIGSATVARLRDAFSESLLPIRIDIVLWAGLTPAFRAKIEESSIDL